MTTTDMMMYWKPDMSNTQVFSKFGRLAVPTSVALRGIYLKMKEETNKSQSAEHVNSFLEGSLMRNKSYFADHSSEVVMKSAASWPRAIMQVWMKRLPSTGRANRLAAGLEGYSSSLGPPLPITMASRVTRRMSQYRNCWSATLVFTWTHIKNDYLGEKKKQNKLV